MHAADGTVSRAGDGCGEVWWAGGRVRGAASSEARLVSNFFFTHLGRTGQGYNSASEAEARVGRPRP